ncbi:hypothetical protein Tco_1015109 [Tanacetum coccineum]|uniref:Uncharacterized protein n=1 Tax=Tanacetum coccineum TaxID=301880 RepID=A0ABQ5FKF1_9ASTR
MRTEMELTLEQTQQGVSYEVSVSIEGAEEWKEFTPAFVTKNNLHFDLEPKEINHILIRSLVKIMLAKNIRVISFTMKMEILLEPTSNKLMVDPHGFEGIFKDGDAVYLDNRNMALLQMLDLTIHDLDRFFNEVEFVVDLDFIQRYGKSFVRHTFLQVRDVKSTMNSAQIVSEVQVNRQWFQLDNYKHVQIRFTHPPRISSMIHGRCISHTRKT